VAVRGLPRGLTPVQLAGGFGLPFAAPLPSRIEDSFRRQLDGLPDPARRLLLVVAADPSGDPVLARRAAGRLGSPAPAAGPAGEPGLPGGGGGGGGSGPAGVRRPHMVPASSGAFGGVPVGVASGPAGGAFGAGGGDRSADRSGSPGLAPGQGRCRAG